MIRHMQWIDLDRGWMFEARRQGDTHLWTLVKLNYRDHKAPETLQGEVLGINMRRFDVYREMDARLDSPRKICTGCDSTKAECKAAIKKGSLKCCPDCSHAGLVVTLKSLDS